MKHVDHLLNVSEAILGALCVTGFVVMFTLGVATVFFRFVVEESLTFPDELIRYLFIWMVMLGAAIAYRRGVHAAISMVADALPPRSRRVVIIIATLASGGFFSILIWDGSALTLVVQPQVSPALEISMSWVYAAIPVGGTFLLIYALELLAKLFVQPLAVAIGERRES